MVSTDATESRQAGRYAVLATLGQCGPLVGTNVLPESEGSRFVEGKWVSAGFSLLVAVLSVVLSL